jgi:ferredoxin-NADP reductase
VFQAELDAFARRGVRVVYLRGDRSAHGSWLPAQYAHVTDLDALRQLVPDVAGHEAYLCGPPAWMDAARTALQGAGIPTDHIHLEEFAW